MTTEEIALIAVATVLIGSADFFGGVASRSAQPITVSAWSQGVGVPVIAVAAVWIGGVFTGRDAVLGLSAGLGSAIGVVTLYRGFAVSAVGIVAPVAAATAAALPVLVGVVSGERPEPVVTVGIGCALVAVVLVGYLPGSRFGGVAVSHGLVAGLGFALMVISYAATSPDSGVWSAVVGRIAATGFAVLIAVAAGASLRVPPPVRLPTALAGVLAAVGMAAFVTVSQVVDLVVLGVALGLFPVVTVLLAALFLRERLVATQWLGVGLAAAAVVLMNAGGA